MWRIDGNITDPWSPIEYKSGNTVTVHETEGPLEMLEHQSPHAYGMLLEEPWHAEDYEQEIDILSGLSYDRIV